MVHRSVSSLEVTVTKTVVSLEELTPVRRFPTINEASRCAACAAADVHVLARFGLQAAMSRVQDCCVKLESEDSIVIGL